MRTAEAGSSRLSRSFGWRSAALIKLVAIERITIDMAEFGFDASKGAAPELIGRVVAELATNDAAAEWNGPRRAINGARPRLQVDAAALRGAIRGVTTPGMRDVQKQRQRVWGVGQRRRARPR
jgi:hypothetical protein